MKFSSASIFLPLAVITVTSLSGCSFSESQAKQELKVARLKLLSYAIDFRLSKTDVPFLESMISADSILDVINIWAGIDKKTKQQTWFLKEDIEAYEEQCEEMKSKKAPCGYAEETKKIERAIETAVKAYEESDSNISNEMFSLGNELNSDAMYELIHDDLSADLTDEEIDIVFSKLKEIFVYDVPAREKVCDEMNPDFYVFARYKSLCAEDFLGTIRAFSNEPGDSEITTDMEIVLNLGVLCSYEQALTRKNSGVTDWEIACPRTSDVANKIKWDHDIYLSDL